MFSMLQNNSLRLAQLSFLMLFVELTIIRWTGANIYYLFAFSNFVLMASFLGIGLGFIRPVSSRNLFFLVPIFLALIVCLCYHFSLDRPIRLNPKTDNLDYYGSYFQNNIYPIWLTLPLVFSMVAALMMAIADEVKRVFQVFPPLQAYRWEVLGSLCGLIVFSILSFLHAKPLVWGIIISLGYILCYLPLLPAQIKKFKQASLINSALTISIISTQIIALGMVVFVFAKESMTPNHFWSAYYKIVVKPYSLNRYAVDVNGLTQQIIESVEQRKKVKPFYFIPYQKLNSKKDLNRVLVVGAGTGGDVAIALSQGAKQVDAIEIDPMLYELGRKFNPNHVYDDPRVRIFINDGRAFLQQSKDKYDMIIFALTDSLMLIMGQSSLRLENYLYTHEGISAAAKHLTPNGIFTIYNYIQPTWFVDRLANTFKAVFNHAPYVKHFNEQDYWATVLIGGNSLQNIQQFSAALPFAASSEIAPATDDHPFIYLQDTHFSFLYFSILAFILFISLLMVKVTGASYRSIIKYFDLFLMGAAFLLLETKNIINFALLFGTTWFVNALVFIGILFSVYLAVEVANRAKQIKQSILYVLLLATLYLAWLIPNAYLLNLSELPRFVFATVLAFSPIFIANLLFAERFKFTSDSTAALGANLIGAVFGGLLEYSSLVLGYRNLFILIAGLYTFALLCMIFSRRFSEDDFFLYGIEY
jgi:predicted membrane-bound spermidine synthase